MRLPQAFFMRAMDFTGVFATLRTCTPIRQPIPCGESELAVVRVDPMIPASVAGKDVCDVVLVPRLLNFGFDKMSRAAVSCYLFLPKKDPHRLPEVIDIDRMVNWAWVDVARSPTLLNKG